MQYGSSEARQLFPRILQLRKLCTGDPEMRQLFIDRVCSRIKYLIAHIS